MGLFKFLKARHQEKELPSKRQEILNKLVDLKIRAKKDRLNDRNIGKIQECINLLDRTTGGATYDQLDQIGQAIARVSSPVSEISVTKLYENTTSILGGHQLEAESKEDQALVKYSAQAKSLAMELVDCAEAIDDIQNEMNDLVADGSSAAQVEYGQKETEKKMKLVERRSIEQRISVSQTVAQEVNMYLRQKGMTELLEQVKLDKDEMNISATEYANQSESNKEAAGSESEGLASMEKADNENYPQAGEVGGWAKAREAYLLKNSGAATESSAVAGTEQSKSAGSERK